MGCLVKVAAQRFCYNSWFHQMPTRISLHLIYASTLFHTRNSWLEMRHKFGIQHSRISWTWEISKISSLSVELWATDQNYLKADDYADREKFMRPSNEVHLMDTHAR